ncbi:MAG TPA: FecR domain-containing protein [Fervidobacterium sp.]|nr:FecR domain-containing protein [Fervidobacterium sp.]
MNLQVNDRIKTFPNSRATIFWADGSVTRLSEKTSITITSLEVSKDLSSVQIRFETESGKTWSNVIRSLLPDSFFEQSYDNGTYVATVRGTVFEVNLEKDYAHAVKHGISIRNTKQNTETEVLQ